MSNQPVGKDEDVEDKVPDDNRYETPETLSPDTKTGEEFLDEGDQGDEDKKHNEGGGYKFFLFIFDIRMSRSTTCTVMSSNVDYHARCVHRSGSSTMKRNHLTGLVTLHDFT